MFIETTSSPDSAVIRPVESVFLAFTPSRSIFVNSTTLLEEVVASSTWHTPRDTAPKSESVLRRTNPTIA